MLNDARGQAQRMVELSHPLGVTFGKIVIDGDQMDPFSFERIQIDGKRRHQGLSFAGFHFGDAATMENHAADQLHVEMPHVEFAARHFPAHGKRFGQDVVQCPTCFQLLLEILSFIGQGLIGKWGEPALQAVDLLHDRSQRPDFAVIFTAEDQIEYLCNHRVVMRVALFVR